jgi:hypothetical protein
VRGSAARAKRISVERECEPVLFMTAARWFSTVRWPAPAAREPHRPVANVVLPYAVKSYRETLHCCDTGFFRRCSCPTQDGAVLNRRVDDSLLAVVDPRGVVDGTPASLRMRRQIHHQDHTEPVADCTSALRKVAVDW